MLILGPAASPTMSAVTWYRPTPAGSLMTRSPSTTSRAGSVMLEPTSPGSLSTVTTSSSATFSCRPPQRTIAYTRELSLSVGLFLALSRVPRNSGVTTAGSLERAQGPAQRATPDWQGYQTPAVSTNRPRGFGSPRPGWTPPATSCPFVRINWEPFWLSGRSPTGGWRPEGL